MPGYANSETTRTALIMVAGELFAEHGLSAVTTRAIAKKAGENIGIIHYHFGGKGGLINAVMDFVYEPWSNDPLGNYLKEHRHLLKIRADQSVLLADMIKKFFSILFFPERPLWCTTLPFQVIQRDLEVSRKTFAVIVIPVMDAFIEFYYAISGKRNFEQAFIWAHAITAPAVLMAVNPLLIQRLHPNGASSDKFMAKLETSTISNAIMSIESL